MKKTLAPGESGEVEVTKAGVAVVAAQLEDDVDYVLTYQTEDGDDYGGGYVDIYLDDELVDWASSGSPFRLDDAGDYRLVIGGGSPGEVVPVALEELDAESVELPATVSGSLGAGEVAAYEFEVDGSAEGELQVDVNELSSDDYSSITLLDPDGYSSYYSDGDSETTTLVEGTWTLVVNGGADGIDYEVELAIVEEGSSGGGGSSDGTTVSVAPGAPVTVPIDLEEGQEVDISAYPSGIADIRLVLFDPAATPIAEMNDWSFGSETISLDSVPASGTYLLEVSTLDVATDVDVELYTF